MVTLQERAWRLMGNPAATEATERRIFPRKQAHGHVAVHRLDHSVPARRQPVLSMSLRDISLGGLSALSDTAVNRGERLSVLLPSQGTQHAWGAYGRVLRCDPSGMGYRVAVEFDPMPAAA